MAKKQRHPAQEPTAAVEERRTKLARLMRTLDRPTLANLADQLGISVSTVRKDMRAIREQWREDRLRDWNERVEEELAKLDLAEQEAWRAVAVAQRPKTVIRRVQRPIEERDSEGNAVLRMRMVEEVEQTTPGGADLNALNTLLKIMERRARLLGLDQPERLALEGEAVKQYIFSLKIGERKLILNNEAVHALGALDAHATESVESGGAEVVRVDANGKKTPQKSLPDKGSE
jgi:hypothetical protein